MRLKVAVLLFCITFLFVPMQAFASEDVSNDLDRLANHIKASGIDSDWDVIALSKAGKLTDNVREAYLTTIKERVNGKQLSGTDLDKTVLVVKALGQDPENYENHDLIKAIYSDTSIKSLMDFTYALTALSSDDYVIPSDALWTTDRFIHELAQRQTSSGGWGWAGDPNGDPDVDTTCMVLTALSRDQDRARDVIDKAINYLERSEQADGGFVNYSPNSNSAAQVIIALSSLGIDPTEGAFNKEGRNPVTNLEQYKANGGYKWATFSESDDAFSNEQVIQALVAYSLFSDGDQLFNFRTKDVFSSSDSQTGSAITTNSNSSTAEQPNDANPAAENISTTTANQKTGHTTIQPQENVSSQQSPKVETAVAHVHETQSARNSKNRGAEPSTKKTTGTVQPTSSEKKKSEAKSTPSAQTSKAKHQTQSDGKQSPKRVTTVKKTELNPLHLYLGGAFVLLGIIGLYIRYRLGGARYENQ
ncbi:hypothetical protein NOM01_05565 [Sporolactobacillus sp. STSJ-5]|uniref:prenyltransferase/squalene oxidase repeat-containing protein n=1 Tax=Sporolactobacillus sp. STSJ-5 TaxID=2965076 RepID=UPI0021060B1F|nr:prenyltransferase/squalene oxidase repeat-containing protein [Sporolactobacillus sp. STSJ-5]MCQ2009465.1 hypothetical protein [Sporolactobacillus sp. STSJ-5]